MINHEQMLAINRFADDLRANFPIRKIADSFTDDIKQIFYRYTWDVIATLQNQYRTEFELYAEDVEAKVG